MLLWHLCLQIILIIRDFLFVCLHPSLWRFYLFFQLEYLVHGPYFVGGKELEGDRVFGYTPLMTAFRILNILRLHLKIPLKNKRFIDLGSGDGRFVFMANLMRKMYATGIENNETFIMKSRFLRFALKLSQLEFIHTDFLEFSLKEEDVVFIAWTTFTQKTVQKLVCKMVDELKTGSVVVTLSFPVEHTAFKTIYSGYSIFSWGMNQFFISQKQK